MGAVSSLLDFKERREAPILVLLDVHNDHPPEPECDPDCKEFLTALDNCRMALEYARRCDLPVAFVRRMAPPRSFLATRAYPSWIADLRPRRSDMVFERALPSCYASSEFVQMANRGGHLILAGLFGETSCLSTLTEGYGRGHVFTYLADASVSHGRSGISSAQMQRSVVAIASSYSAVSTTGLWVDRMSQKAGTSA